MSYRLTCSYDADADLAGVPAVIREVDEHGHVVLDFDNGSSLQVPLTQVRAMRLVMETTHGRV